MSTRHLVDPALAPSIEHEFLPCLSRKNDGRAGHFAASLGKDLSNLPPAFIAVGALDLFADESMEYAQRLVRAGVPAELHVYPGAIHGFDGMPNAWMTASFKRGLHDAISRAFGAA